MKQYLRFGAIPYTLYMIISPSRISDWIIDIFSHYAVQINNKFVVKIFCISEYITICNFWIIIKGFFSIPNRLKHIITFKILYISYLNHTLQKDNEHKK